MSRRAAAFHLTLGEIVRSTDTSPDTWRLPAAARYRNIKLALPVTQSGDSQLDLFSGMPDAEAP